MPVLAARLEHYRRVQSQPELADLLPTLLAREDVLRACLDVTQTSLESVRTKDRRSARGSEGELRRRERGFVGVDGGRVGSCSILNGQALCGTMGDAYLGK